MIYHHTAPPVITLIGDVTRTVTSPEDITISVTIGSSNLPITVQWSFNNEPLTTNSEYTIATILSSDNTTGNSSLIVLSTNTGDDGNYIVNVSNLAGSDMTTISVEIHGEWRSSVYSITCQCCRSSNQCVCSCLYFASMIFFLPVHTYQYSSFYASVR